MSYMTYNNLQNVSQMTHTPEIIIGIDNGISGGLVAISAHHGLIIAKTQMPICKPDGKNEVNVLIVSLWIRTLTDARRDKCLCVIEKPVGSKSAQAGVSMAGSFHALRGCLQTLGYPVARLSAKTWQKALRCDSDAKKAKAATLVQKLWPDEDWRSSDRCRKPHDGMVDAALIAYYSKEHLTEIEN